ncbi:MAG: cob(I)yrinic acid a,c-diamide adenosyltransferase [Tidjanibacter sp.]|nr:cob(I)yrinic acid a,c-diamide adenosyltransferase [Tidjanibacter sp.]
MARIYTRSGDKGTTSLIGGERVAKTDPRVEAYGCVDELGAHIALLGDFASESGLDKMVEVLDSVAVKLMTIEAELALSDSYDGPIGRIEPEAAEEVERWIDGFTASLPPLKGFTIPGGHRVVSQCHVCRTVCRRAERRILSSAQLHPTSEALLSYINRLSDLLYTLSRWSAVELGVEEKLWQ